MRLPTLPLPRHNLAFRAIRSSANLETDSVVHAVLKEFDYAFAENGLTAYKLGQQLPSQSFIKYVGEERYKVLVNFILHYIADLDVPIKRCAPS